MNSAPRDVLRFTWRGHLYLITQDYQGDQGYLGIQDGRIAVRGANRAEVTRALITGECAEPILLAEPSYGDKTALRHHVVK